MPKCGWLTIYLLMYLIQIFIKTVVDILTTEKFYFAFQIAYTLFLQVWQSVGLSVFNRNSFVQNIFPEVLGFFVFIFQKFPLGPYSRKSRNKEKYNMQTCHSSSKQSYYKSNESDLLFSLEFRAAVFDLIEFTAAVHGVQCSTWT